MRKLKNIPKTELVSPLAKVGVKAGNPLIDRFYEEGKRIVGRFEFAYPKTRFVDLLNYYKSIKAEENVYYARLDAGINPQDIFEHLKKRRKMIESEYGRCIHWEDNYSFETLKELGFFLRRTLFFQEKRIADSLRHEERHFRKIVKRGYKPYGFECWLCLNELNRPDYITTTRVSLRVPMKKEDYRAITKANKKGSCIDDLCKF
jgi:hypothetical protein